MRNDADMTEWGALVEAARPYADGQRFKDLAGRNLDWPKLLALAEQHGTLPLLVRGLVALKRSCVAPDIWEHCRERERAQVISVLRLTSALYRVLDCLEAAGIEAVAIKGPVLSWRCYGDAAARQYGDVDLIVHTRDIQRTTEIMMELNYQPRIPLKAIVAGKIPGEYVFRRADSDVLVEFHTEHTFRYHPRRLPIDKIFARQTCVTLDQHRVPALSVEDELVLVCVHASKHLWERLAWVADVASLLTGDTVLQWERATAAASEVGAERMLRVGVRLATEILGVTPGPEICAYVNSDGDAIRFAKRIARNFPGNGQSGLLRRALFRMKMRGAGLLPSLGYLMRLSFSPTEYDWANTAESSRPWLLDAMSRPIRLARKYRREA